MKTLLYTLLGFLALLPASMAAESFTATNSAGQRLTFEITDALTHTVVVSGSPDAISGTLVIPGTITVDDVTYTVTGVGDYAFMGKSTITGLELPATLLTIGKDAFVSTAITDLVLPKDLIYLGPEAFSDCKSLKTVTINSGITALPRSAFSNCWALEKVIWSKELSSIGDAAFYADTELNTIVSLSTVPPTLGEGSLMAVPTTCTIVIPKGTLALYKAAPGWESFNYREEDDVVLGLDQLQAEQATLSFNGQMVVLANSEPTLIEVYDLSGRRLCSATATALPLPSTQGVLLVKAAGTVLKVAH